VRTTLASLFAIAVGTAAACGGDDGGYNPPGDDDGTDEPDAMRPDADPNAPDAATTPDALGDGSAPLITPITPPIGGLVRGTITISASVVDADGISEVTVEMGGRVVAVTADGNTYSGVFDTAPLAGSAAPIISIRAVDGSGAESHKEYVVVLDNESPLASMDTPNVRTVSVTDGIQCSVDFNPLGGDAPRDGQSVRGGSELRARVEDRSNAPNVASNVFVARAGVGSVDAFVLDDSTRPLVVDTNGDGVCDEINPEIVPATNPDAPNEALVVALDAADPAGTAFFAADTFGGSNLGCTAGDDDEAPEPVCLGELGATIVIDTSFTDEPAIYGIPLLSDANCMGYFVDATVQGVADGWSCAAVRAVDNLGNVNVSAPLRLCIDDDESGDCLPIGDIAAEGARPNCTGTVTGGVVTNTPCTPETFFVPDDADEFELIFP
jgi:hypothetical protein